MRIQFNTDHNIEGGEGLAAYVDAIEDKALRHVSDHITRVKVHLTDESSNKSTPHDKRCVMEARIEGHQPIAVTEEASTADEAVEGAATKLCQKGRSSHRETAKSGESRK